jgi:hypothetical protein
MDMELNTFFQSQILVRRILILLLRGHTIRHMII